MKKDIANKWMKALRSGKYKQGTGKLKDPMNYYCCLGVLCEVLEIEIKPGDQILTHEAVTAAGMRSKEGFLRSEYGTMKRTPHGFRKSVGTQSLIELNDKYTENFNQIADIIEKEWEYL